MSFREKIAWAAFVSTIVIWGGYFTALLLHTDARHPPFLFFIAFIGCVVLQAVVMVAVAIVGAMASPKDARAPIDERERGIARRATEIAYYFQLSAILALIAVMHLGINLIQAIFALFALVVIAEAIRYGAQAIGYRRRWHG